MRSSFNVLDRGWIPVVTADGSIQELGIRETLAKAHELREISDPSPLEEYSVYRFLSLFLMDALRPKKISSIRRLLKTGCFDMAQVEQYIALCESEGVSFDLFDEKRPFLQSGDIAGDSVPAKPITAMDCTLPSGNNHTHFEHDRPQTVSPQNACRLLLTTYWFSTAAAQGYPSGVYGAPPYFSVIKGKNLFESLTSLLVPEDSISLPFDNPPALWRRTKPIQSKAEVGSTSWMQGMLFPTRKIRLIPDDHGQTAGVFLLQGENFVNKEAWRDPHVTYRSNDTTVFPLRPHADAPIWRNLCEIADIPGDHASAILRLYRQIHEDDYVHLTLYGAETSQASYLSMQRHDLSFPLQLSEPEQVELLTACVAAAQNLGRALRKNLSEIEAVPGAVISAAVREYDAACEKQFWKLCEEVSARDADLQERYSAFCKEIADCVMKSFDHALSSVRLRAHTLALAEEKRGKLYYETIKLKKEANP